MYREATSAEGERCVLTWGGGGGEGEGVEEFVAGGKETFQSGVQDFDGVEDDGLLLGRRGLPLFLLCANIGSGGINLFIQLVELLVHLGERRSSRFVLRSSSSLFGIDFLRRVT